ncbi:MAG TPA: beta-N-acetylhexosaminidase [Candidatus Baltobacteraceae bacterium]|nr:beta-N-acetylhexosaminidase [Candidatus Baltobacteraceae bacterium]
MNDLHTLAAGVVCVGFDGTKPDDLDKRLVDTPFAGYILFARNVENVEQTAALSAALQQHGDGLPRIVAIDQEGGRVARLRSGVEELPAMMAVAAAGSEELAQRAGAQMGYDLRRAGVNLDFAPVLDLALFEQNTVIGARSFGDDPQEVARFARAFARGLRDSGMLPTYKHFPGHGSTEVDSHLDLPVIDLDEDVLRGRDLAPFRMLLADAPAVMTAHIIVNAFDRERAATVSRAVLGDLLRDACGFEGVCFTDCMQMDAIAKGIGSVPGGVEAIRAGADCVLVSHSIDIALQTIDALVRAVEDGSLDRARLEEAHRRVTALRRQAQSCAAQPLPANAPFPGIGREIGRAAVTPVRGEVRAETSTSIIVSFEGTTTEGVQGTHTFHATLEQPVQTIRLPLEPAGADLDRALQGLQQSGKRPIVFMRRAHVYEAQRIAVERIVEAYPDALLVSLREPYDAFKFPQAATIVCTYGDDAPSIQGLGDVLFGGAPAAGRLPLHVLA